MGMKNMELGIYNIYIMCISDEKKILKKNKQELLYIKKKKTSTQM